MQLMTITEEVSRKISETTAELAYGSKMFSEKEENYKKQMDYETGMLKMYQNELFQNENLLLPIVLVGRLNNSNGKP